MVRGLWARGFDATCTSTQLRRVPKSAGPGCKDIMDRVVFLPLTPQLPRAAAKSRRRHAHDFPEVRADCLDRRQAPLAAPPAPIR
eukprot:4363720-Pyramimonas_sp.AAC.1